LISPKNVIIILILQHGIKIKNMKNLFILFFLVLCSFNIIAQSQLIKGSIVDEQKNPIPYVNVYLSDKSIGVVATNAGTFEFNCLIKKNDSIVFSCLGYKTVIVPLSEWLSNSNKKVALQITSTKRRKKLGLD
jgi:hypothetical protein